MSRHMLSCVPKTTHSLFHLAVLCESLRCGAYDTFWSCIKVWIWILLIVWLGLRHCRDSSGEVAGGRSCCLNEGCWDLLVHVIKGYLRRSRGHAILARMWTGLTLGNVSVWGKRSKDSDVFAAGYHIAFRPCTISNMVPPSLLSLAEGSKREHQCNQHHELITYVQLPCNLLRMCFAVCTWGCPVLLSVTILLM